VRLESEVARHAGKAAAADATRCVDLLDRREVNRSGRSFRGQGRKRARSARRAGHARSVDPVVHPVQAHAGFRSRLANLVSFENLDPAGQPGRPRRRRADQREDTAGSPDGSFLRKPQRSPA